MLYGDDDDDDSAKRSLQPPPFLHSLGTQFASVMQCAGRVGWNTCRSRALAAATTLEDGKTRRGIDVELYTELGRVRVGAAARDVLKEIIGVQSSFLVFARTCSREAFRREAIAE